jgi:hypothetical protein
MPTKQFTIRFVFGVFVLLALIGLFNRIVDPFWYYRDIEIPGFNAVKTKFDRFERYVKPALLMRDQPEAIILGSSFSEIGFDPTNPLFTDHARLKSMNFALSGAQWDLVQCEFEFAVSKAPIKRALVGFTPGNLPIADCAKSFSSIGQVSNMQLLLSDSALQASIDTIRDQNKTPSHTREGMYFMPHSEAVADNHFREFFIQRVKEYQRINKGDQCLKPTEVSDIRTNLALGQSLDLSGLQRMIKTAQNHGIELVLYAYPSHAYMLELQRQCGDQDTKWQAMKQISDLIDVESAKGGRIHAYQFYGYHSISTEAIEATPAKYWYDPMHFNSQMGNIMLDDMFSGNSPKLGRVLTSANINADYHNFLQRRTEYLRQHPEFQAGMQKLLPQN